MYKAINKKESGDEVLVEEDNFKNFVEKVSKLDSVEDALFFEGEDFLSKEDFMTIVKARNPVRLLKVI